MKHIMYAFYDIELLSNKDSNDRFHDMQFTAELRTGRKCIK